MRGSGKLYLYCLVELYKNDSAKTHFFNDFFDKLAGSDQIRKHIEEGMGEGEIRSYWKKDLEKYKLVRKKYLLYPDFTLIIADE